MLPDLTWLAVIGVWAVIAVGGTAWLLWTTPDQPPEIDPDETED